MLIIVSSQIKPLKDILVLRWLRDLVGSVLERVHPGPKEGNRRKTSSWLVDVVDS